MAKMSDPQIGAASARNAAFESTFTRGRILSEVVGSGQARFIVDVGAYTGETAEWFCELFPHATVVAIEPFPDSFALLEAKSKTKNRIKPFCFAAADSDGTVTLHSNAIAHTNGIYAVNPESLDSIVLGQGSDKREVENHGSESLNDQLIVKTQTLDSFLHEWGFLGDIDLLKIDVQAAEIQVLKGSDSALARTRAILIEISLYDYYVHSSSIGGVESVLTPHGFSLWSVTDVSRNPMNGRTDWVELLYVKSKNRVTNK
jgi:FkbM family methyltransferase